MKKPDDDLKIDISEIFGGELNPIDTKSEESSPSEMEPGTEESDSKYQAFIDERNKLLEAKTAEIESGLTRPLIPVEVEPAVEFGEKEIVPTPEPVSEPAVETDPELALESGPVEPQSEVVIDFNTPMMPPFMGPVKSGSGKNVAETSPVDAIAADAEELKAETAKTEAEIEAAKEAEAAKIEAARIEAEKAEALRQITFQKEFSFFLLYNEYREIIGHELKDLVGERKTNNMLVKTFEMSREKYPEVFRNANWDASGNLLEDGSLDATRMAENTLALDVSRRDITVNMGLTLLMNLRLQAIEKGLGAGLKNKLRARLIQWVTEKGESASPDGKEAILFRRLKNFIP